ncbi:MAG TPA: hypothetical protein VM925_03510 [Labilithrix sp.]|nr:hypothetical protein [Labilithrix sp.]
MNLSAQIEDFRVPVRRTRVEVQTERGRCEAFVFLPPSESPEQLLEEDDKPFFPAEQGGAIRLYARCAVMSLTVDSAIDPAADSMAELGIPCDVRSVTVHMRNGTVLTGNVTSVSGRMRTLDILNQPARSFAHHSDGKIHYVSTAQVERVEEIR